MSEFKVNITDIKLLKKIRHWYTTRVFNISSISNFIRVIFLKAQTVGINILKKIKYWCSTFIFNLPSIFNSVSIIFLLGVLVWVFYEIIIKQRFNSSIFAVVSTALGVCIALQQWLTNEKSNRYKIHDKIIECYDLLFESNSVFFRDGTVDKDCLNKYVQALRISRLYSRDPALIQTVEELHDLGKKAYIATILKQSYDNRINEGGGLMEFQKNKYDEAHETLQKIFEQIFKIDDGLHKIFRKYTAI